MSPSSMSPSSMGSASGDGTRTVLITGAAGNLGGFLARHLAGAPDLRLRLMIHRTPLAPDLAARDGVEVAPADLARPETLDRACAGVDCIVHFAGVLFRPFPERFLPTTNTAWGQNLFEAARRNGVGRVVLVSFPHVEGPTTPAAPATDRSDRTPVSAHARTRLEEERALVRVAAQGALEPVILRAGMVYGRDVLMVAHARRLMARRLLGVWRRPTGVHLIALTDFLNAAAAAIRRPGLSGVYNVGDDAPTTLQAFLDRAAAHWGLRRPWRAPRVAFFAAAAAIELFAWVFRTQALLTRDFVRIGMVDYAMDTARFRRELLPELAFPTLESGLVEL